ncbi:MAG: PAS domain-containing sensor histidine kinase [Methanosarcina sp.]
MKQSRIDSLKPSHDETEKTDNLSKACSDLLKNQQIELASKESFHLVKVILNAMLNPVCYKDKNGVYLGMNESFVKQIVGLPEEEVVGCTLSEVVKKLVERFPERANLDGKSLLEYAEEWDKDDKLLLEQGGSRTHEYEGISADGIKRDFLVNKSTFNNEKGEILGIVTVLQDITERNKAEKVLQESEERYRIIIEKTGQIVYDYDLRLDKGSWIGAIEEITGYTVDEFQSFDRLSWIENVHPDDREQVIEKILKAIKTGGQFQTQFRFRKKEGNYTYIESSGVILPDRSGSPYRALGVMKDINGQKLTQIQLEHSEEKYRITAEQTGQLVYDFDVNANKISWAGAIEEITGFTAEEFKFIHGTPWLERIHPEDLECALEKVDMALKRGGKVNQEFRFRKKNGDYIYLEERGVGLLNGDGKPYRILGVMIDVTEKKLAQQKIQESEERYRSFVENFKGIAFETDENFIPLFLHGAVEEITGYTEEEFMSRLPWKEIIDPEFLPVILEGERKIRGTSGVYTMDLEFQIKSRTGKTKWVHETFQKIPEREGKPEIYQGVIYDITERKIAEETLENLENARKREIHHRIKNNLQVISSLLDLQAEKFKNKECVSDSEVLEAFKESQDRVISIALIHEELHEGGGANTLNFSPYLKRLVENLFQTYRLGNKDIKLFTELEKDVFFDMDTAVPLGLIVNELVSNSLKHAFPGRRSGEIQIKLAREPGITNGIKRTLKKGNNSQISQIDESKSLKEELNKEELNQKEISNEKLGGDFRNNGFVLKVSDNGVGIPKELNIEESDSLGLQLINILVAQLEGEIEIKTDTGTEFIIKVDITERL